MSVTLHDEFAFYVKNQKKIYDKHAHKWVAIVGDRVIGAYDTIVDAIRETAKTHELGTFLVQYSDLGEDNYTITLQTTAFAA